MKYLMMVLLFLSGSYARAATYWVSPTGTAAWSACSGSTPIIGKNACPITTSFANAVAGDIVNAMSGTYDLGTGDGTVDHLGNHLADLGGFWSIVNAGTSGNPITFQAYTGETPVLQFTLTGNSAGNATIKVIMLNSYVTFSGFTMRDTGNNTFAVCICGIDNVNQISGVIFENNIMTGGSNPNACIADNHDLVRFEDCDGCTIQKNNLGPFTCDGYSDNGSIIKLYRDYTPTIKNNEIHDNGNSVGISIKGYAHNADISYNYFHGNAQPFRVNTQLALGYDDTPNLHFYQNLLYSTTNQPSMDWDAEAGTPPYDGTGIEYYNNTIYNAGSKRSCVFSDASAGIITGLKWHDNICYAANATPFMDVYTSGAKTFAEEDHNNYFNSGSFSIHWNNTYNSLNVWQTSGILVGGGNPGTYLGTPNTDIASDPLFANASGSYSQLADFNLKSTSPSKGAGRGGLDLGAQICAVGPKPNCSGGGVASAPPAAPRGFTLR